MSEFDPIPRERPAISSVFYILVTALVGFILVGPLIGFLIAIPTIDGSLSEFQIKLTEPLLHPEIKTPLMIIQGSATLFGLIVGPLLYWSAVEKKRVVDFIKTPVLSGLTLVLIALVVLFFMMPNSMVIDWNAHVHFPDSIKDLESWARHQENYAEEITKFLTTFATFGEFLVGFLVIAILPGIGEELVFRGMLQPQLQRATGNANAAIWISAILFSALHFQFFGFIPRVLLGALFGYLYYWSGNLIVPMFAHFVNNGFSVIMLYLHQKGKITIDVESTEAVPWPAVISGTILTFGLLVYLKKLFDRNRITT